MFPSSSFNHKDISKTYPCKTIEISKVTLTKIWISVRIKLKGLKMARVAETCSLI